MSLKQKEMTAHQNLLPWLVSPTSKHPELSGVEIQNNPVTILVTTYITTNNLPYDLLILTPDKQILS